ncbi:MAG: GntR family transcriptional regulator [Eubacteriales bacterium]
MIEVDLHSRKPIYEQLVDNVTMLVVTGVMKEGEQVPSVRQLSVELAVNPNTVQKAYTELERRGVLYSVVGKGRFVNGSIDSVKDSEHRAFAESLSLLLKKMKLYGIDYDEVIRIADSVYIKDGNSERKAETK